MNRLARFAPVFLLVVAVAQPSLAAPPAAFTGMDATVGKCLDGYNAQDYKQFYSGYAKVVEATATEQAFQALYVPLFGQYGKVVSRKLDEASSSFSDDVALVVYSAEFQKLPKAKVSINFLKEDGVMRILQVTISPAE